MRTNLLCLFVASTLGAAEFYVSPSGRDANAGTKAQPFQTLQRARDEVRKLIAAGLKENVTVWVRGGLYTLTEPLVLGLADSGSDRFSITYAAAPGEEPVLSGGVKIEGWKELDTTPDELQVPARGKVWVADVPASLGRFYSLYDAQGHLPRARCGRLHPRRSPHPGPRKPLPDYRRTQPLFPRGRAAKLGQPRRRGTRHPAFHQVDHEHPGASLGGRNGARGAHETAGHLPAAQDPPHHLQDRLGGERDGSPRPARRVGLEYAHPQAVPLAARGQAARASWRRACAN